MNRLFRHLSSTGVGLCCDHHIAEHYIRRNQTLDFTFLVSQRRIHMTCRSFPGLVVTPAGAYYCYEYEFSLIWTTEVITLNPDGSECLCLLSALLGNCHRNLGLHP